MYNASNLKHFQNDFMIVTDPTGRQASDFFNFKKRQEKELFDLGKKHVAEIAANGMSDTLKHRQATEVRSLQEKHKEDLNNKEDSHKKEYAEFQKYRISQRQNIAFEEYQKAQQTREQTERERINIEQRLAEEKEAKRQSLIEQTKNRWGLNKDKEKDRDKNKDR